jgi:rRNA maturation endonuclease Nob1
MNRSDNQLGDDRYYCRRCDVTFREPVVEYYDVTPCPYCGEQACNVLLEAPVPLRARRTGSAFW